MSITVSELLARVTEAGLPVLEQAAFFKIASPPFIMHIRKSNADRATRIDLKGFESFTRRGLVRVDEERARRGNLGNVSMQVDFDQPDEVIREAFDFCLSKMRPGKASPPPDTANTVTVPVSMRLPKDLADALEKERHKIESASPKGIEVTLTSAIRVLLYEAVAARSQTRSI